MEAQSTWSPANDLYTAQSSTRVNISAHVPANELFLLSELLASNEGACFHRNQWRKIEQVCCSERCSPFHRHSCVNSADVPSQTVCMCACLHVSHVRRAATWRPACTWAESRDLDGGDNTMAVSCCVVSCSRQACEVSVAGDSAPKPASDPPQDGRIGAAHRWSRTWKSQSLIFSEVSLVHVHIV